MATLLEVSFCATLALLSVWLYSGSLQGDFVFDDRVAIEENKDVTSPKERPLSILFNNNFWGDTLGVPWARHHSYRPITVLSFRWTHMLFGLNTYYYHLGNVILNAVVVVLYFWVCRLFIPRYNSSLISAGATLLFATHSVHVEAVAGIVGRADLLASLFGLIAIIFYARSCNRHAFSSTMNIKEEHRPPKVNWAYFFLAVFCCGLAMLCKETGICITAVLALYDLNVVCNLDLLSPFLSASEKPKEETQKSTKKNKSEAKASAKDRAKATKPDWLYALIFRLVLLVCITTSLLIWRFSKNKDDKVEVDWSTNPANHQKETFSRLMTKMYYNVWHAWLLIWPEKLSADWACQSIPVVESIEDGRNIWSILLLLILSASVVYGILPSHSTSNKNWKSLIIMCTAWTVIPFLPSCGFFLDVGFVVAERLLYTPSQGICLLAAAIIYDIVVGLEKEESSESKKSNKLEKYSYGEAFMYLAFILAISAALTLKTVERNQDWNTEQQLYKTALDVLPGNCRMHHNYATTLDDIKDYKAKKFHLEKALELWDEYGAAYTNLGVVYAKNSKLEDAVRVWKDGIKKGRNVVGGDKPITLTNIATGLKNLGKLKEALEYYELARQHRPNEPRVLNGIQEVRQRLGRT
eukprot:m.157334 g.157334  ORF g.157334 m.157334 type:complete len:638 (+) comp15113_c0_seq4:103-2016(+)